MKRHKQVTEQPTAFTTMMTPKGLMRCTVAEFKPGEYKGLKQNVGKPRKEPKTK